MNKKKIINDPVYGFIRIPSDLIYDLIEHPYFQRLRRIKQVGLAEYIYPGALHTRFSHALGAMHLMTAAIEVLRTKGTMIFDSETEAAQIAILLHDLGHGPFSHVLENTLLENVHHEHISNILMHQLNDEFGGALNLAIQIFSGDYHRNFLHELVSSQLDMDRLDYLNRDCFFTGVVEGTIGVDRIIQMLKEFDNQLVVEEKGLLSVENFLNARRLMYWQVYLHKTSIAAEQMLVQIIKRAKFLKKSGEAVFAPENLEIFLTKNISLDEFSKSAELINNFAQLDDTDIWYCIKNWSLHKDVILSKLSKDLLNRKLYKIQLSNQKIDSEYIRKLMVKQKFSAEEIEYYLIEGQVSNAGYLSEQQTINILMKSGKVVDIAEASDLPTIKALSQKVVKNYLCYTADLNF